MGRVLAQAVRSQCTSSIPLLLSHSETVEATVSRQRSFKMEEESPVYIRFSLSEKKPQEWGKPLRFGDGA